MYSSLDLSIRNLLWHHCCCVWIQFALCGGHFLLFLCSFNYYSHLLFLAIWMSAYSFVLLLCSWSRNVVALCECVCVWNKRHELNSKVKDQTSDERAQQQQHKKRIKNWKKNPTKKIDIVFLCDHSFRMLSLGSFFLVSWLYNDNLFDIPSRFVRLHVIFPLTNLVH